MCASIRKITMVYIQCNRFHTFTADNAMDIILQETGKVFAAVLEDAGVFKYNEAGKQQFLAFADYVNNL